MRATIAVYFWKTEESSAVCHFFVNLSRFFFLIFIVESLYSSYTLDMDIVAVGSRVRVLDERSEFANVGMISVVDEANHTADIMYDNEKLNEECQVSFGRLRFLEPWEEDVVPSRDPNELKEFGNTLFTLKDFTAAMKLYQRAIKEIDAMLVPSVGGNVLISENGDVQMGMISSDLDNDQYEVLLTNNEDEKIYPKSALICLPAEQSLLLLLRSVYMNLSRCAMKKSFKGWAVHYTSMAIAIVQTMLTDSTDRHNNASATSTELQKQLNDGLYLRAKALLTACRPARAKLDAQQLRINGDVKRAEQLEKEISTFKQQRQKQDRRLAKDIAAWIDTAMSTQQQEGKKKKLSLSSATAGAFDEDEDFTLDEDEDEGNEDEAQTDQSKQQKGKL